MLRTADERRLLGIHAEGRPEGLDPEPVSRRVRHYPDGAMATEDTTPSERVVLATAFWSAMETKLGFAAR